MKLDGMKDTVRLVLIIAAALVVAYIAIKVLALVTMIVFDVLMFVAVLAVVWLVVHLALSTRRRRGHPAP